MKAQTLFDANANPNSKNWYIIDDVVMGGRSSGDFGMTKEGYAKFSGTVSLENNGGFSSVRYAMETQKVTPESKVRIHLKGDGSNYQFRVRHQRGSYYSYITKFETTGNWQTLEFQLKDLYPTFRGRRLDLPDFNHDTLTELAFLIGNKKAQKFSLVIEKIALLD